jgi:hypothetical protein
MRTHTHHTHRTGPLEIVVTAFTDRDAIFHSVPTSKSALRTNTTTYLVKRWDPSELPPFLQAGYNQSTLHEFFEALRVLELTFTLYSQDFRADSPVFYVIPCKITYDFRMDGGRGKMLLTSRVNVARSTSLDSPNGIRLLFEKRVLWLDPVIAALSLASLALILKAIVHSLRLGRLTYNHGLTLADLRLQRLRSAESAVTEVDVRRGVASAPLPHTRAPAHVDASAVEESVPLLPVEAMPPEATMCELPASWDDLSLLYKFKYIDPWFPLSILAALCTLSSSILEICSKLGRRDGVGGFSLFCLSVCLSVCLCVCVCT